MISPHSIPLRYCIPAGAAAAILSAALLLHPRPVRAADDETTPAQRLTGQAGRSVLPARPDSLDWQAPGGLWARGEARLGAPEPRGEAQPGAPEPQADAGLERAALALGLKREMEILPSLSWSLAPRLRVETAGDAHGLPAAPALDGGVQQDLTLALPGGTRLSTTLGLQDRIGAGPAGSQPGTVLQGRVSVSVQAKPAGRPVRAELQLATTRALAPEHGLARTNGCELAVLLHWGGEAPLRLAGSCPGDAAPHVTLGVSANF